MKNADKPITPIYSEGEIYITTNEGSFEGLTKREYFAGLAMQGIMSRNTVGMNDATISHKCVQIADELLKQLEG
jgi:hypothetical protein